MKHTDDFDQVLNDALSEYREAEPLAGVENRILQRLDAAAQRRRLARHWLPALAAVAAIIAVCAWLAFRPLARGDQPAPQIVQRQPQAQPAIGRSQPSPPGESSMPSDTSVAAGSTSRANHVAREHQEVAHQSLAPIARAPEREQFPIPEPLSPQERELLVIARNAPEALRGLSADDDLAIAPIDIKPLDSGGTEGDN